MSDNTIANINSTPPVLSESASILTNVEIAPGVWRLSLATKHIAELVLPGQFVHLLLDESSKHILRRPISVQSTYHHRHSGDACMDLIYQVVGKGTRFLTGIKEGKTLQVLGSMGRYWQPPAGAKRALLVGGGIGWVPLAMLAGMLKNRGAEVHALIGASNAKTLTALVGFEVCLATQERSGKMNVGTRHFEHWATDDGSMGHHGFNTELIPQLLDEYDFDYIATCGPEPMQKIVARLAADANVPCEVSLERRMACGVGACLSCVVDTTDGKKRACVDGPVFNAEEVIW